MEQSTNRFNSFKNRQYWTDVTNFVESGFYYKGPEDIVKCWLCKVEIKEWNIGDNPNVEHLRWSPSCSIPKQNDYKHPDFSNPSVRLDSFKNWPKSSCIKKEDLSEAGFFYIGIEDRVKCFCCGVGLKDWERR